MSHVDPQGASGSIHSGYASAAAEMPDGDPDVMGPGDRVGEARYCIKCAYALVGLPVDGDCPECATPVELSLREQTLANAAPEYLQSLASGLSLVLNGILLMIMVAIGAMVLGFASGGSPSVVLALQFVSLGVSAMILLGYWKFTQPDPGQVALEANNSARSVIRVTVVAQVFVALADLIIDLASSSATGTASTFVLILSAAVLLSTLALWAVQFFAVMRYTRWIATRVPDAFIMKRTKRYMWLLPLLYGPLFVTVVGPLIALVLYWNLLDRLRKHVKSIRASGTPAPLKGLMPEA